MLLDDASGKALQLLRACTRGINFPSRSPDLTFRYSLDPSSATLALDGTAFQEPFEIYETTQATLRQHFSVPEFSDILVNANNIIYLTYP